MISVASAWLAKTLRLHDAVEPERPLSIYGLDSLATVEFRNWVRSEFGAVLSVVDITRAISLAHLAEAIVARAGTASA
jgi:acyl carrier protein